MEISPIFKIKKANNSGVRQKMLTYGLKETPYYAYLPFFCRFFNPVSDSINLIYYMQLL